MKKLAKLAVITAMAAALVTSPPVLAQPVQDSVVSHQYSGIVALSNPAVNSVWVVVSPHSVAVFNSATTGTSDWTINAPSTVRVMGAANNQRIPVRVNGSSHTQWIRAASFTNGVLRLSPPANNCNGSGQCWL